MTPAPGTSPGDDQVIDYLTEHGPSTRKDFEPLHHGLNPETKMRGAASFDLHLRTRGSKSQYNPGTTFHVYYLMDEHDERDVLRKWFEANPLAPENIHTQALAQAIGRHGSAWKKAWKDIKADLKELTPDDVADCQYCGLTFHAGGGLASHERDCEENPNRGDSPNQGGLSWSGNAERAGISKPVREADDSTGDEDAAEQNDEREDTTETMPPKKNTHIHMATFLAAQYFKKTGYGARHRDLANAPLMKEYLDPVKLKGGLSNAKASGYLDAVKSKVPDEETGTGTIANVYYPTNVTIDYLREVGVPTKLPGSDDPLPDKLKAAFPDDIPTARVGKEEVDEVRADPDDLPRSALTGKYDRSDRKRDYIIAPGETTCRFCGKEFDTTEAVRAHLSACDEYDSGSDDETDESTDTVDEMLGNYSIQRRRNKLQQSNNPMYETFGTINVSADGGTKLDEYDTSLDDVELPSDDMAEEEPEAEPADSVDVEPDAISTDELLAENLGDILELTAAGQAQRAELARILLTTAREEHAGKTIRAAGAVIEDDDLYRDLVTYLSEGFNQP